MKANIRSPMIKKMHTDISRQIEFLAYRYRDILPNGWRCCIECQDKKGAEPYLSLDLESEYGAGAFAPIKMQTLKTLPRRLATGVYALSDIVEVIKPHANEQPAFVEHILTLHDKTELTDADWEILKEFGLTHWHGGIRIPYEELRAGEDQAQSSSGEIRIAFSGAKEWQDVFFSLKIFQKIQEFLEYNWECDGFWYDFCDDFETDLILSFWITNLEISGTL